MPRRLYQRPAAPGNTRTFTDFAPQQQGNMAQHGSRFVIGIDLGTTNSAVSYLDLEDGAAGIQALPVPQLTAAGEMGADGMLPSFLYLPGEHELPAGALALPWDRTRKWAVGIFAREQGARVPGRLVASAKSWLAHGGVDRTAPILPWGGDLGAQALSPVAASSRFLEHLRAVWDERFGGQTDADGTPCSISEQTVVLTVPASFDEAARELTVQAARDAGIGEVVLLEEPLAAFYGWLSRRESSWNSELAAGETVLIVDVGGGTTDFSLVHIADGPTLRRTAVGDHLLLGGDNMDMALAREIETAWGGNLDHRQWSMLCHQCRAAKERLLSPDAPEHCQVAVAGAGRSLVAGTKVATLERERVAHTLLAGFYPPVGREELPAAHKTGMRQMGLPYVADPAVTRHLAAFLRSAANVAARDSVADGFAIPSRILFNGGSLLPQMVRDRLCAVVGALAGREPIPELAADDLSRAVSVGAAYYGMVRRGRGVRIQGGIARAYFLEVGTTADSRFMCILPRDRAEGDRVRLDGHRFKLATNRTVRFNLFSSSTRIGDAPGTVLEASRDLARLPAMDTVIAYGRGGQTETEVILEAVLNEVGTLDICCETVDGHHRFPLSFNLRSAAGDSPGQGIERVVDQAALDAGAGIIAAAFAGSAAPAGLYGRLENALGMPREAWGAVLLRRLAAVLLDNPLWRVRTPQHESRWLNLAGYLMRPGFGVAGDDLRMRELWKLWHAGPAHPGRPQVAAEWWILWRRIAGGLREGQQQQVGGALIREVTGDGGVAVVRAKGAAAQILREQWRCLAALERLPVKRKAGILHKIAETPALEPHMYWVVARLAARHLLHGPENSIVPADRLDRIVARLLADAIPPGEETRRHLALALAASCARCGVRNLEVAQPLREQAAGKLRELGLGEFAVRLAQNPANRNREEEEQMLGDSLPPGLTWVAGG